MKVLLVDDNEMIVEMLESIFCVEGIQVDCACSVKDALKLLLLEDYKLVISDIVMPGLGGLWLIDYLRNNFPNITVIAISSYDPEDFGINFRISDRFHFWEKGSRIENLLDMVKGCLAS